MITNEVEELGRSFVRAEDRNDDRWRWGSGGASMLGEGLFNVNTSQSVLDDNAAV